jgi:hypothetical protein
MVINGHGRSPDRSRRVKVCALGSQ